MRSLPLILFFADNRESMMDAVVAQSRITHNNKESDEGCRCYADMISHAMVGAVKEELREVLSHYPLFAAEKYDRKSGGYIVDTLRTVFHFFFATDSLEDCLIEIVACGEDADTCAALAGGLAGCHYGLEAIPKRWTDALDRSVYEELSAFARWLNG